MISCTQYKLVLDGITYEEVEKIMNILDGMFTCDFELVNKIEYDNFLVQIVHSQKTITINKIFNK